MKPFQTLQNVLQKDFWNIMLYSALRKGFNYWINCSTIFMCDIIFSGNDNKSHNILVKMFPIKSTTTEYYGKKIVKKISHLNFVLYDE